MLKEVIEDALARGERLKKDIVAQILKSATLNELINNRRFAETIAKVIQTKYEITRTLKRNVEDALKAMSIPSRQQISTYEKRVEQLERRIDTLGRHLIRNRLHRNNSSRRKKR